MSETELNFDLDTFLPYRIHQASEAVSQSFRAIYRDEYGMTRSEWRVLAHLGQYGAMTATEIGRAANLHKTKVSRAVFAMEKRRWLRRRPHERDRRLQTLHLTRSGHAIYGKLGQQAKKYNGDLAKKLGEQSFADLLALAANLQRAVDGN